VYGQVGSSRRARIASVAGFIVLAACAVTVGKFDDAAGASANLDCPSGTTAASVVYVKGGEDTNTYAYDPVATSGAGLHPPLNNGGQAPEISHVMFCVPAGPPTTTTVATRGSTTSTTVPVAGTSASANPQAEASSGTLPFTGGATLPLAIVGGVLLIAGVVFLFAGLRRAR
jgi:hypothetical protein